ncbi:hypothetical protein RRG08_043450 [Elysia crispata]|uniref:Uncharacterized protein n=1 Tax=Elysia crispata TaxID=231223 RepID=A0AAE1B3P1_9GAST|nr:hypothetical protein RRG08_043450 [Elysia crispata]
MPKSRLPRGDERARRHSRAEFLTQRVTRNTSRPGSIEGSHIASVAGSAMMGGSSKKLYTWCVCVLAEKDYEDIQK